MKLNCCLVFDIGKTNQKYFVFDKNYKILAGAKISIPKIEDEDGHIAEDIKAIVSWMKASFEILLLSKKFQIEKVNFCGFGATMVHLDKEGNLASSVYDYHKTFEADTLIPFFRDYGPESSFIVQTGSKNLNFLNSGKQLYWLKHRRPEIFKKIHKTLHLPQYLSYVFTGKMYSEYTSIGCHTDLWDYQKKKYHYWVEAESLDSLFPPIVKTQTTVIKKFGSRKITFGIGIHDSSAALLTYLLMGKDSFILLSTGTWCINFNPFTRDSIFNLNQIKAGATAYMKIDGSPVKSSRLFLGEEHRLKVQKLINQFNLPKFYHRELKFDNTILKKVLKKSKNCFHWKYLDNSSAPNYDDLNFSKFEIAYYQLIKELVELLQNQINVICEILPKYIYVDGGFSDNNIFIEILKRKFPDQKIKSKPSSYSCALGSAMLIDNNFEF